VLIGYVSDQMYVAIPDAQVEFTSADGLSSLELRSRASGAVWAELVPGTYAVTIAAAGFGSKTISVEVAATSAPIQFRLLSLATPLGYVWPKYATAGQSGELRMHVAEPFHVSLWRYGWQREKVRDIGWFEAFAPAGDQQTLPDGDIVASGVDWNHGRFANPPDLDLRTVTAPERSGLYYFHLKTQSGMFTSFPWVVAPAAPRSRIAVLASDMCWNAYNDWGGRSNYVAASRLPDRPSVSVTQESPWFRPTGAVWWVADEYDPLSFDRPEPINATGEHDDITDPITRTGTEHVAPGEWRLLGWLENQGYPFDLYAESQLHDGTLDISAYDVLVLNCHPEYWTTAMYDRVKAWVYDGGGRLIYLGGNGINCSVDIDGAAMVAQNMNLSEWLPSRSYVGPGALMPSRFGLRHELESTLLGVGVTLTGMGSGAPYTVVDSADPIFAGTSLADGEQFGQGFLAMRCPGGASGHETDKRDAGTPPGARLLAIGVNADAGGAEFVTYTTPSGGRVYSVGSINWTTSMIVDSAIATITRNMLDICLEDS
jgi:N,N-dimethylformamidase